MVGPTDNDYHWDANLHNGRYRDLAGLLKLQDCKPEAFRKLPAALESIVSPLTDRIAMWDKLLGPHPDKCFAAFLLSGLSEGFQIGFEHKYWGRLKAANHNMLSCMDHREVVEGYLAKECFLSRTAGPFEPDEIGLIQIGVIPKKGKDTWRLIVDLSSPHGRSVNDGICSELCSLSYITVDMIGDRISELGWGTLMAKLDIKSAFRIIPVHPVDRCLLGMQWQQRIYVDRVLPFGLRSAPRLFSAVADGLQFIARSQGIENVAHYLDDFIVLGRPGSDQCDHDFQLLVRICEQLGVPLAEEKKEGPANKLEILGILFDREHANGFTREETGGDHGNAGKVEGAKNSLNDGNSGIGRTLAACCKGGETWQMLCQANLRIDKGE